MTACMSAFTRVGVNMSRADVLHWACAKCSTCCRNAEGPSVSAQRCCRSFDLSLLLYSCNNRDAADCGRTRAEWRRAGWINASGQEEQGDEERRRRELRYEPRGFVCLRLKVILPLIQQQNFSENSLAPKSFRNLPQVQVIPSLTYSPTHKQGREINNLDRVSNR